MATGSALCVANVAIPCHCCPFALLKHVLRHVAAEPKNDEKYRVDPGPTPQDNRAKSGVGRVGVQRAIVSPATRFEVE